MSEAYVPNFIIPAAPGTRLERERMRPLPIVAWRLTEINKASPVVPLAPRGTTIVVLQPDGSELSVSAPKAPPSEE